MNSNNKIIYFTRINHIRYIKIYKINIKKYIYKLVIILLFK